MNEPNNDPNHDPRKSRARRRGRRPRGGETPPGAAPVSRSPFAWVAVALSLAALAAAAFAWYQVAVTARLEAVSQRGAVERMGGEFGAIERRQDALGEELREARAALAESRAEIDAALAEERRARGAERDALRDELAALSDSLEKIYTDLGRSVDSWRLEETGRLLLLANRRLALSGDFELAMTALRLADAELEQIADPALLPVRKRIAAELAELAAAPRVDVSGAALKLLELVDVVERMPLSEDGDAPEWERESPGAGGDGEESTGELARFGRQILDDFSALVRIRRVDETRMPKFDPVQRFLIDENLKALLHAAQYALLRRDAAVFKRNVDNAVRWIERYFDLEQELTRRVVADLQDLAALPLAAAPPPLGGSLELLRQQVRDREDR